MLAYRVIPCLDVSGNRVVKGTCFKQLQDAGDPVGVACHYAESGADELVFLDVSATVNERDLMLKQIEAVAARVFVPLTVGGGVRCVDDVTRLLNSGADKVSINSAALASPELVQQAAQRFGSQCIVVAVDAKRVCHAEPLRWGVYSHGGSRQTHWSALDWVQKIAELGAGEILLTSIDQDGTRSGFDAALLRAVHDLVTIPVIASGGVGNPQHFVEGAQAGADGLLAASIFHFGVCNIQTVKAHMAEQGLPVRL